MRPTGTRRAGRSPRHLAGPVLLGALLAAVAVIGEADGALGGVEPDDTAGEGGAGLGGPEPAVELGEQDVVASGVRDQPDAVAAHRLDREALRGRCGLDPQLHLAGGEGGGPVLGPNGEAGAGGAPPG